MSSTRSSLSLVVSAFDKQVRTIYSEAPARVTPCHPLNPRYMCTTQAYRHELGQPLEVELDRLDLELARRERRHLAYHSK